MKRLVMLAIFSFAVLVSGEEIEKLIESANSGVVKSQYYLGFGYLSGLKCKQDYAKSAYWFGKAADNGSVEAQYELGKMYFYGQGVATDSSQAEKLLLMASENGAANAQYFLGAMYFNGAGVKQDDEKAFKWVSKSADQGNSEAQCVLGKMYAKGIGVTQDYRKSVEWFAKSVNHEFPSVDGQFNLGLMYAGGLGVTQDYVAAHMWLNLACSNGIATAGELRDSLENKMSPSQVAEAQKLARDKASEIELRRKQSLSEFEKEINKMGKVREPQENNHKLQDRAPGRDDFFPNNQNDFQVHRNEKFGFSIFYPKTWAIVPTTHKNTVFKVVSKNGAGSEDCSINIQSLNDGVEIKDDADYEQLVEVLANEIKEKFNAIIIEKGITQISFQKACFILSQTPYKSPGVDCTVAQYMVQTYKGKYVYTIGFKSTNPDVFNDFLNLIKHMLNSFVLK